MAATMGHQCLDAHRRSQCFIGRRLLTEDGKRASCAGTYRAACACDSAEKPAYQIERCPAPAVPIAPGRASSPGSSGHFRNPSTHHRNSQTNRPSGDCSNCAAHARTPRSESCHPAVWLSKRRKPTGGNASRKNVLSGRIRGGNLHVGTADSRCHSRADVRIFRRRGNGVEQHRSQGRHQDRDVRRFIHR